MITPQRNLLKMAAQMTEMRDGVKSLYGKRWPIIASPYRAIISAAMDGSGDKNPLSAVIPLAKEMSARGRDPTLLMAVAVDMSDT